MQGRAYYASCETNSNIGEFRPPRSIKNASPFRLTMADYICSSSHFVVSLQIQSESYILYIKYNKLYYDIIYNNI